MFEKFTKRVTKRTMEDAKRTIKEEASKCLDDMLPTVVGLASLALLIFANVPPQQPAAQQLVINNFYLR